MSKLLSIILVLLCFTCNVYAAEVRIAGLDAQSTQRYTDKLEPRLKFIQSRPATSWRADDASFYLKRLLIREGFPKAEIQWTISGQTITLKAKPGPRYFFGDIQAIGNTTIDPKTITDYFYQPVINGELVSADKAPYISEYTVKGAENVENYLKSQGYWQAQAALKVETFDHANGRIHIKLQISQGPLHTIAKPQFSGINEATKQILLENLQQHIGQPSISANLTAMNNTVTEYFGKTGYHFATIDVEAKHSNAKTSLAFTINPGKRYIVRDLHVHGNTTTEVRRIKRRFRRMQGKAYDETQTNKATNKLLQSGVFKKVIVTPVTHPDGALDLDIEVEDGNSVTTRTYIGTDSYEGLILGVSYSDLNFQNKMWQLNARAEYTQRGLLGEAGITEPFFLGEEISFNLRGFALRRSPDGYNKYETGFEGSWTWSPNDIYTARAFAASSFVSTSSSSMTAEELGPTDYLNTRIGMINDIDLRNDPILPTQGYHGQLLTEIGSIVGDGDTTYFRFDLSNSYRHNLMEGLYLTSRFDLGMIIPQDADDLPIDRRFFSGGTNSVRSFDEDEMGPRSGAGDPLGGESYWVGSIECVKQVKGPVNVALFYDLGQVYPDFDDLDFSNPSQAAGISVRIHLPIGPIRLEYGHNLNQKRNEPSGTFHFTIGASF